MRRFYAPPTDFASGIVTLSAEQAKHARDVLRLVPGDEVRVFDGAGGEFLCRIESLSKTAAVLTVIGAVPSPSPESPLELTVAATVLHSDKYDLIIQKLVELGAVRLRPIFTRRSDIRPPLAANKINRWRKIAIEAAKQCGRSRTLLIDETIGFDELLKDASDEMVMFSERAGGSFADLSPSGRITMITGPKGGWDDDELAAAENSGVRSITFGGRVLRAETAVISIAAILQHRFGDMN